ncbi:GUN4 domain-containing protein [Nostoc sp. NZL]|uniref:GUN4 domain-containing protein n=1 Tax=Nostoc sp. NZL TaxID=2650612 RepID=UPI0018C8264E|nr:GUN4 domain-containing protein [Nostoc sp. NZL]MBG1241392.1 protein kinase [Nostoc sp. NZL]
MLYCSNSSCSNPFNPDDNKFCIKCGQTLTPLFRNRFRVIRLLSEGGFSRTYEARDVDKIDEPCVIKQFVPQFEGTAALEKATELFKQEAKRLYDLGEHPQIPRLIAYFEQDKRLYLVQELIEGQNLLQELQQQGAFSEEKIKQLLTDLLPILKFIHERGVIHRDIKPENIMRRLDGKLILIDFGVSKQMKAPVLGVGTIVGTPGYAPMEQMRGQVFAASDLYSLGVTCIRLLTQCFPKPDGSDELDDALRGGCRWKKYLPKGTKITLVMIQVLDKLIQEYIQDRYQSVDEVIQVINDENLNSAVGIDYKILQKLLVSGKWREADQETWKLMLKISRREKEGYLRVEDIENFPCQDILTIDILWVKYSNARFGFSIQKRVWDSLGGKPDLDLETWKYFGECLGWRIKNNWKPYDFLSFTLAAPAGQLPRAVWSMRLDGRRKRLCALTSRLIDCKI